MVFICAQTSHKLTAEEVKKWLKDSDYSLEASYVQVYGYWMADREGEYKKEGYWWVAEVDTFLSGRRKECRVYEEVDSPCGYRFKSRYMNVEMYVQRPAKERFRVVDGSTLYSEVDNRKDAEVPALSPLPRNPAVAPRPSEWVEVQHNISFRDLYMEKLEKELRLMEKLMNSDGKFSEEVAEVVVRVFGD